MINKLAKEIHQNAKDKGFFETERNLAEMLCLIHSEVSEALEADRESKYCEQDLKQVLEIDDNNKFQQNFEKSTKNTFEDELADVIIRVLDLAAYKQIDIEMHISAKMRYNALRVQKHGKKY